MVEITKCDKCFSEIKFGTDLKHISFTDNAWFGKERYDLCKPCHKEILKVIKAWLNVKNLRSGRNGRKNK